MMLLARVQLIISEYTVGRPSSATSIVLSMDGIVPVRAKLLAVSQLHLESVCIRLQVVIRLVLN